MRNLKTAGPASKLKILALWHQEHRRTSTYSTSYRHRGGNTLAPPTGKPSLLLSTRSVGAARTPQPHLHTGVPRPPRRDVLQMRRSQICERADEHGRVVE